MKRFQNMMKFEFAYQVIIEMHKDLDKVIYKCIFHL